MMYIILFIVILPVALAFIKFFKFVSRGKEYLERNEFQILEGVSVVVLPFLFLLTSDFQHQNDCCGDSAVFSPEHRLSIYVLIVLCLASYLYCALRKSLASPLAEVLVNCFLLMGVVLNIFVSIQLKEWMLWLLGNVPLIIFFVLMLLRNQYMFLDYYAGNNEKPRSLIEKASWYILRQKILYKFPILLIACLPILAVLVCCLLLFGQKPDSIVRAFTDTYKLGFSQLDYKCNGVVCGGHFLCTIAAKGHTSLVKPTRMGVRAGKQIICNRQLLVSNAFEELLERSLPALHKPVRRFYNRIGSYIHCYYGVFNHKYVSDLIYIVMKPLEWLFLICLYMFYRKPENMIAQQYLSLSDRCTIEEAL